MKKKSKRTKVVYKTSKKAKIFTLVFFAVLVGICVFLITREQARISFTSQLIEAIDIDELSTSKLTYNGFVDVYKDDTQKIKYTVIYHATVKVGIKVDDIKFEADINNKTVKVILPPVTVQDPVVDASSIDFMPYSAKADLKEALSACREDARHEAEKSEKLIETAEENLKTIIEALLLPLIDGYTIVW